MLITRRTLLTASVFMLTPRLLYAEELDSPPPDTTLRGEAPAFGGTAPGFAPGDSGYKHGLYHDIYQLIFYNHCTCGIGECRVTDWRLTERGSPLGYDVIKNREWSPLPAEVWIPAPEEVNKWPLLRRERAHICVYNDITCAIINVTQT